MDDMDHVLVIDINRFPCIVPFSQMYPACCTEIREFIQQVYAAPNEYLQRSDVVDRTVQDVSVDTQFI